MLLFPIEGELKVPDTVGFKENAMDWSIVDEIRLFRWVSEFKPCGSQNVGNVKKIVDRLNNPEKYPVLMLQKDTSRRRISKVFTIEDVVRKLSQYYDLDEAGRVEDGVRDMGGADDDTSSLQLDIPDLDHSDTKRHDNRERSLAETLGEGTLDHDHSFTIGSDRSIVRQDTKNSSFVSGVENSIKDTSQFSANSSKGNADMAQEIKVTGTPKKTADNTISNFDDIEMPDAHQESEPDTPLETQEQNNVEESGNNNEEKAIEVDKDVGNESIGNSESVAEEPAHISSKEDIPSKETSNVDHLSKATNSNEIEENSMHSGKGEKELAIELEKSNTQDEKTGLPTEDDTENNNDTNKSAVSDTEQSMDESATIGDNKKENTAQEIQTSEQHSSRSPANDVNDDSLKSAHETQVNEFEKDETSGTNQPIKEDSMSKKIPEEIKETTTAAGVNCGEESEIRKDDEETSTLSSVDESSNMNDSNQLEEVDVEINKNSEEGSPISELNGKQITEENALANKDTPDDDTKEAAPTEKKTETQDIESTSEAGELRVHEGNEKETTSDSNNQEQEKKESDLDIALAKNNVEQELQNDNVTENTTIDRESNDGNLQESETQDKVEVAPIGNSDIKSEDNGEFQDTSIVNENNEDTQVNSEEANDDREILDNKGESNEKLEEGEKTEEDSGINDNQKVDLKDNDASDDVVGDQTTKVGSNNDIEDKNDEEATVKETNNESSEEQDYKAANTEDKETNEDEKLLDSKIEGPKTRKRQREEEAKDKDETLDEKMSIRRSRRSATSNAITEAPASKSQATTPEPEAVSSKDTPQKQTKKPKLPDEPLAKRTRHSAALQSVVAEKEKEEEPKKKRKKNAKKAVQQPTRMSSRLRNKK